MAKKEKQEVMTREQRLMELDKIATEISENYLNGLVSEDLVGAFSDMQRTGEAIKALTELIDTPQIKDAVMWLQGHTLGFKTDKDDEGGYPWPVVKHVLIDATMQGLPICGNHFNIISGQLYKTKNGVKSQLKRLPKMDAYEMEVLPYKITGEREATVQVRAKFSFNGEMRKVERTFQIVVNRRMGPDAVRAKAKRKMGAEILEIVTNGRMPQQDGEIEDLGEARIVETTQLPDSGTQPKGPDTFQKPTGGAPEDATAKKAAEDTESNGTLFEATQEPSEAYQRLVKAGRNNADMVIEALNRCGFDSWDELHPGDSAAASTVYTTYLNLIDEKEAATAK